VRGTHDAETGSETIEKNIMVNGVKCNTEVEREEEWQARYQLHKK